MKILALTLSLVYPIFGQSAVIEEPPMTLERRVQILEWKQVKTREEIESLMEKNKNLRKQVIDLETIINDSVMPPRNAP